MPNYEYQCTACAHKFELWQTVGSPAPACEKCGAEVKKVFHVPRVIFKGSGFYVTDLRAEKEGSKPEAKSESKSDTVKTEPAATSSASSETKTETASSAAPASTSTTSAPAGGK